MQQSEQDSNLQTYLSIIVLKSADIKHTIDSIKRQTKNIEIRNGLENIEKNIQGIHTLYHISMQHILDNNREHSDALGDIINGKYEKGQE